MGLCRRERSPGRGEVCAGEVVEEKVEAVTLPGWMLNKAGDPTGEFGSGNSAILNKSVSESSYFAIISTSFLP